MIQVPVFPLPNVVFFPGTVLPLRVFEPRYRQLVDDAVRSSEPRIVMALLRPGWESDYYGSPQIFEIGGLGILAEVEERDDGDLNIVLEGQSRCRIVSFTQEDPYRVATIEPLVELLPDEMESDALASGLISRFDTLTNSLGDPARWADFLRGANFQTVVNSICSTVMIPHEEKQRLLEMESLKSRAEAVLGILNQLLSQTELVADFDHLRPEDPEFN